MDDGLTVIYHLSALLAQLIDHLGNRFLIARNGRCRNDDLITVTDFHLLMTGECHTVQCAHGFTLGTGTYHNDLALGIPVDVRNVNQDILGCMQITQLHSNIGNVLHAASADGNLSAMVGCCIQYLLYAIDVGSEGSNNNSLVTALELCLEGSSDFHFTRRITGTLHIGGITHQCQHTLLAQLAKTGQVNHFTRNRCGVNLKVTGVDHHTQRCLDCQRNRICNGMVGVDQLNVKAAQPDMVTGTDALDLDLLGHAVLLKFGIENTGSQSGTINRDIQFLEHIRQRADMVLMSMGNHNAANLVSMTAQVGDIRDNQVNTQEFIVRECQAAVNHKDILSILNYRHIFADLIESAQRYNLQFFFHIRVSLSFAERTSLCVCLCNQA